MTDLEEMIEGLLNQHGAEAFLIAMREVCLAKSECLGSAYDDAAPAQWWANLAMGLENTIAVAEEGE